MRVGTAMMAIFLIGLLTSACAEPETSFGDPGSVLQRRLPNEQSTAGTFDGAYSETANPAPPDKSLRTGHQGQAGPAVPDVNTPADTIDCLSCHGEGNAGAVTKWAFGGRVIVDGAPAKNVDVVVVNPDKKLGPVKSDADGFFWAPIAGGALVNGSKTRVRNAKGEQQMSGDLTAGGGSCDSASCHVAGKQGKVYVLP